MVLSVASSLPTEFSKPEEEYPHATLCPLKLKSFVRGSMGTMTCNGHHNTNDIKAELARICDQFREGLLATVVSLCASQLTPALDEGSEETRRTIEKIKAKEFISVEEAALLFGCSEQHLRNQVQKAIDGASVHPIPFADLEGVVRFPLAKLLEWAPIPKPRARGKTKVSKKHGTHLSAIGK